jgi:hypothetical protein
MRWPSTVCLHFLTLSVKHIQDPDFTRQLFDCQYTINISGLIHLSFVDIPFCFPKLGILRSEISKPLICHNYSILSFVLGFEVCERLSLCWAIQRRI